MIEWKYKDDRKPKMLPVTAGEVTYLTYPAFSEIDFIRHGFSTRLGGVSVGEFSSMNLSFGRKDDREKVLENYRRISAAIGFSEDQIVTSDQTHTTNVRRVSAEDCGSGITRERDFHDVDGMITDEPGVVLATFYADCVPLYFVDIRNRAIGLSHSGWKGTAGRMGEVTIRRMTEEFGTRPEDLVTAIGPSICQSCYEVSGDVIAEFQKSFRKDVWDRLYYRKENGKYQLNLWEANRQILLESGVAEDRIHMPNLCTCCNPQLLFSHRASAGRRGNLAAFLQIRQER